MARRLNYRLLITAVLILALSGIEIAQERRPSFLRPGLRLYAFVANAGDGTVSVVDLIRVSKIATIAVGPAPSGLRAHPKFNQIWGVSTEGGYAFAIDSATGQILARIPVGASPFELDFSRDGNRAYVAASGSSTLVAIDCRTGQIVGRARTGRHPWLARVTPDGKQIVVPNREDSTVEIFDATTLASLATIGVASHPEQVVIMPDSSVAFVSATGSNEVSAVDLKRRVLVTNLRMS